MTALDPKIRTLLDLIAALGDPPLAQQTVAEFRARRERGRELVNAPWPEPPIVRDVEVSGAAGILSARIYDVEDGPARPTLIYFHGGGFVYGSIESHHPLCCRLSVAGGMRVISVAYRLAPESPWPHPHDDALAATRALIAGGYGVDAKRVAVGGDSAGACLAAVVARRLARSGPKLQFQLLIYPVTQAGDVTASRRDFAEGYFLTREVMDWFESHYLPADADLDDESISPLRTPPPKDLAPAYVITAGFDPLLDEGRAYAELLKRANVPVEYREYRDQIHGFVSFTAFSHAAIGAIEDAVRATRLALG
jgi:acetyl esterase